MWLNFLDGRMVVGRTLASDHYTYRIGTEPMTRIAVPTEVMSDYSVMRGGTMTPYNHHGFFESLAYWLGFLGSVLFGWWCWMQGVFSTMDIVWISSAIVTISGAVVTSIVTGLRVFGPALAEFRQNQLRVDAASAQGRLAVLAKELSESKSHVAALAATNESLVQQIDWLTREVSNLHAEFQRGSIQSDRKEVTLNRIDSNVQSLTLAVASPSKPEKTSDQVEASSSSL